MQQIQLGGSLRFIKPSDLTPGDEITGRYLGTKEGRYTLEHKIVTDKNETIVVNGTGQLDALMEKVAPNSLVRIVYQGKNTIASGAFKGKEAHSWELYADQSAASPAVPVAAAGNLF